jgi:hypothetical protein
MRELEPCQAHCGRWDYLEAHHLYLRSLRPDLVKDPRNILKICRECHRKATDIKSFQEELQQKYYPKPPKFKTENDLS